MGATNTNGRRRSLISAVELSHRLIEERWAAARRETPGWPGDFLAVDATAGNGWDTAFLAELPAGPGRVLAFDVQEQALQETRRLLDSRKNQAVEKSTPGDRGPEVELIRAGHETLARELAGRGLSESKIALAMFNLGYLPHGDKSFTTSVETTMDALRQVLERLCPGGLVTVVLYRGHEGGGEEADAVLDHAESLDPGEFQVGHWRSLGAHHSPPPELVAILRRA